MNNPLLNKIKIALPPVFRQEDAIRCLANTHKAPQKVLESLVRSAALVRLKRGVYAFADDFDELLAASILYGPSYASFETALSQHGLIPERVEGVLSVVDGRKRVFNTPMGEFTYFAQRRQLYALGMTLVERRHYSVPIATPEKALLDTLMRARLITGDMSDDDIWNYVERGLRVDGDDLRRLSLGHCRAMAPLYRSNGPKLFVEALARRIRQ